MARIDLNGNEDPNYQPPQIQQPAAPTYNPNDIGAVQGYYTNYLHRPAAADDPQKWLSGAYGYGTDLGSIENAIKGSPEAQAYAKSIAPPGGGNPSDVMGTIQSWMASNNPQGHQDPNYWVQRINESGGLNANNLAYWQGRFTEAPGTHQESGYGGTNVFSDPATAQFEQLLNSMIGRFNTPQTPPGYQQAIDQMNAYLAKLNGPAYTPAQLELQQTQALDPLQQAHDTQRQQLMLRLGQQGISPSSGIFEKALEDLDRQFSQARTQTQANFANQAIGIDRQNAATAAQLAPQISNFQQAQTGWQDSRALQAEQLAYLIPQMAQQRLTSAGAGIQQLNPTSLLNMIQSFQNQGYNQGAGYGSALTQLLAQLFGL